MTKPVQIGLSGLFLLLVLLSVHWFYNNFRWVDENKDIGFQGLAQTNSLLAAEFFLRKMGVPVQQVNGLTAFRHLPSTQQTILITTQRKTINPELSQRLLDWVKAGGHLIIEAHYLPEGITDNMPFEDELLKDRTLFVIKNDVKEENSEIPVTVSLKDTEHHQSIQVNFPYNKILTESFTGGKPIWHIEDDIGSYLLQFSLGQGLLTVLTSTDVFKNEWIGNYDHAQFLHYLVQLPEHDKAVWLVRVDDMVSLWYWLWLNAQAVMLTLSGLFLLWFWRISFRFGSLLNDKQEQRRSLLEHIRAGAYYRWHHNQSVYLLQRVQQRLWFTIKKNHPSIVSETPEQMYKSLANITGMSVTVIQDALPLEKEQGKSSEALLNLSKDDFTKKVRQLEFIRKKL